MRGIKVALNLTDQEKAALDCFGSAVMAANSVDMWASDREGEPYWAADRTLMLALEDLFGEEHAQGIRDDFLRSGESVTHAVEHYWKEFERSV